MRILLGDPDRQVADRGDDEGIGDTVPAKVRNALALYRPLRQVEGVAFRFHRTVLYNSIYRADDQLGEYSVDRSMRLRIEHYVEGRPGPYLG